LANGQKARALLTKEELALLRRTERIVLNEDEDTPEAVFVAEPALATGPVPDRRNLEMWLSEVEKVGEKQKAEKKGLDALRAEVQRTLVTSDGEVISSTGTFWRAMLKPSRLALLGLALVAGGIAAYFAMSIDQTPPVAPPPPPTEQVLVATRPIALGQRLSAATLEWKSWPTDALRDDYITQEAKPQAIDDMTGAIVRFEFFPGEPIRAQKLALPGDGYLSAVLGPGELGVSIPVQPDVAAGGFVQPNDHVDGLLTQAVAGKQVAKTLLSNVRVLAIAQRLGEVAATPPDEEAGNKEESGDTAATDAATAPSTFNEGVIATLALDSQQAEIITSARDSGSLTLVLRSITDFDAPKSSNFEEMTANQQIRLTSPFWTN
jgi:pilus assembly protein CpaB